MTNQTQTLIFQVSVNGNLEADSATWLVLETSLGLTKCPSPMHTLVCRWFSVSGAEHCAALPVCRTGAGDQLASDRGQDCWPLGFHFLHLHPALPTLSL